jgi:eukaryotic-like serine/threonine-protein kinase
MLTTEKLFRGDTEFALMEKVRKAEVPLPSDFNRRVTPELDAIVTKALARDVADRYQSATQLAADLDALIGSYRFDPKELRQLLRQLFRKEYAKEVEDTELALDASLGSLSMSMGLRMPMVSESGAMAPVTGSGYGHGYGAGTPAVPSIPAPSALPALPAPDDGVPYVTEVEAVIDPAASEPVADAGNKTRSFWGSLFKKRK